VRIHFARVSGREKRCEAEGEKWRREMEELRRARGRKGLQF